MRGPNRRRPGASTSSAIASGKRDTEEDSARASEESGDDEVRWGSSLFPCLAARITERLPEFAGAAGGLLVVGVGVRLRERRRGCGAGAGAGARACRRALRRAAAREGRRVARRAGCLCGQSSRGEEGLQG
jgi:hypothetical protein